MKILALTQTTRNQKIQQNQGISPVNQTPKYDSVSFGIGLPPKAMEKLQLLKDLEIMRVKLLKLLTEGGTDDAVGNFLKEADELGTKSPDFVKEFVLSKDDKGNSLCQLALEKGQHAIASDFVWSASRIYDESVQRAFVLSKNQNGDALFDTILKNHGNWTSMLFAFLETAAKVAPHEVLQREFPEVLTKKTNFSMVNFRIATNRGITKEEKLAFLRKYNHNGSNDVYIEEVGNMK